MITEIEHSSEHNDKNDVSLKEIFLNVKEWIYFFFTKWILIVVFVIIGILLGFIYASSKKTVYIASTTFVLENGGTDNGFGQYAGIASMVGLDLGSGGGDVFQGDNIIELYKSRTIIEQTLLCQILFKGKKELLIDHYISSKHLRKVWSYNPDLANIKFYPYLDKSKQRNRLQDSIIGSVVADIRMNYLNVAKPDKKIGIIAVDLKSNDEFFAKNFNDQIVKNVNDFYVQTKTKKIISNIRILQFKTDSVRSVMNGAIYSSAAISDATPNLNPTKMVQRIVPLQRSQFTAESNKTILTELVKNLELSKMSLLRETPLIQVIDKPIYPLPKSKFSELKGMVIGGVLGGVLIIIVLFFRRMFDQILNT